ncbi:16S rRNA (guanine(527)-N(7))-methyltransferase RsmG [Prochlorococcus sp. MIT 1307]|uniref:16S rRNA (guanine(527)-N(7))-methyltransferase RsmG n=1 Tax=Prochlorococcus sp. MIT 1307 TaxID=3096219 RepID=UPI002A74EC63|nr:16S rRNA (guanine(527)-N(7))-methyltransferase RsmG [Prochlorococcus sp. MIT 1307]
MSIKDCFNKPSPALWEKLLWHPSSTQLEQFCTLQNLLSHFNKEVNLTRLLNGEDYWIGHVFDSLWPMQTLLSEPQKVLNCIDVGTGCGFPGWAVAIALPKAHITLVDATKKKTTILQKISVELDLNSRINILTDRIENTGQNMSYRGVFDLAMARAVADAPIAAEYLIPLLKQKGEAFLFRGKWSKIDEKNLNKALFLLKARIKTVESVELPAKRGKRHLIKLQAKFPCPESYPRPIGIPEKKPLGI